MKKPIAQLDLFLEKDPKRNKPDPKRINMSRGEMFQKFKEEHVPWEVADRILDILFDEES